MDSYLDEAIDLLCRVNRLRDRTGERLACHTRTGGFETWWFSQEQLYWLLLVPYLKHRDLVQGALKSGGRADMRSWPEDARMVLERLRDSRLYERKAHRSKSGVGRSELSLVSSSLQALIRGRLQRSDTAFYAIDVVSPGLQYDFRLQPLYDALKKRRYRYVEYVHITDAALAVETRKKRGRDAVYYEVIGDLMGGPAVSLPADVALVAGCDLDPFGLHRDVVARCVQWMLAWSRSSILQVRLLKRLLRIQGACRAIVLDDSRHAQELVVACKSLRIPVLSYMHGLLNRYHPGLMAYGSEGARRHTADLYGLWSEYFRRRVTCGDLYDESNTFVCGPLRQPTRAELSALARRPRGEQGSIRVLVVSEPRTPPDEVAPYLRALLTDVRIRVAVKTRPGEARPYACRGLGEAEMAQINLVPGGTVFEAFADADVVIAAYSSVLYEAAMALLPIVHLSTSFSYGKDIATDGLAVSAESPRQICAAVRDAAGESDSTLKARRERIWGSFVPAGASALLDEAEERLWEAPR